MLKVISFHKEHKRFVKEGFLSLFLGGSCFTGNTLESWVLAGKMGHGWVSWVSLLSG